MYLPFLESQAECITSDTGRDVAEQFEKLTPEKARQIGQAAKSRILSEHTYDHRAEQIGEVFGLLMEDQMYVETK